MQMTCRFIDGLALLVTKRTETHNHNERYKRYINTEQNKK